MKIKNYLLRGYIVLIIAAAVIIYFFLQPSLQSPKPIENYFSLQEWKSMLAPYPQFPNLEQTDWFATDYKSIYTPLFPLEHFKTLLTQTTQIFTKKDIKYGDVLSLQVPANTQFYLFNHLEGHVFSLINSLYFLNQKGIISDSLEIIDGQTHIVFIGNTVGRSAYNIETLALALLLIKKNPDNVFLLAGEQEAGHHWKDFAFKDELQAKARSISNERIPLEKDIDAFFDTLPSALFIAEKNNPQKAVRISSSKRNSLIVQERLLPKDIAEKRTDSIAYFRPDVTQEPIDSLSIPIAFQDEDRLYKHNLKGALSRLEPDQGAIAWTFLSAPINAYQKYLDFYENAFVKLTIESPIEKSTITLYTQDSKNKDASFQEHETINATTGLPALTSTYDPEKEIVIGSTMSLEQGVPIMGLQTKRGMMVRIHQENKKGGINNQFIRAVIRNDNYTPNLARENVDYFLKNDIKTLLLPLGSPTLDAYLDYIKENALLVLFPLTGSPSFRNKELKGLINLTATYLDGATAMINTLIKDFGIKKFAFFYQSDAYGMSTLKAAHEVLKKEGITQWTDVAYTRGNVDLEKQAKQIIEAQPEAIGLFSTTYPTQEFIRRIGIEKLTDTKLFAVYFLGEEQFRTFIARQGLSVLFDSPVPNPWISDLEIAQEYRTAMDAYNYPYDVFSFQAYIATSVFIHALSQIKPPFTNEKISAYLESIKNFNFKGYPLNFNPNTRSLAEYVWIETTKEEAWEKKPISSQ